MWKASASAVCGCLAALPLIGCAGDVTAPGRAAAVTPSVIANITPSYVAGPRTYAVGPAQPATILVVLPGTGVENDADLLFSDPAVWAAQGLEVEMPRTADLYRLVADERAEMARFIAATHALANGPIWLVGTGPAIDAVLATAPQSARGVAGAVVTSVTPSAGTCSESVFYADPGNGAAPQIEVRRSGDCGTNSPAVTGRRPSVVPAPPSARPNGPRIIEASAVLKHLPPAAQARRLAQLMKSTPPG